MNSRHSVHKRIAVVKSATYKSISQGDSRIKIQKVTNTSDVMNVVVTVFDYIVDMKLIIKFITKGHTKITSFGGRAEGIAKYVNGKISITLSLC